MWRRKKWNPCTNITIQVLQSPKYLWSLLHSPPDHLQPFSTGNYLAWLESVSVIFCYNQIPPNVCGVIIATWLKVRWCHLYATWMPQQRRTLKWWHTCCLVYSFLSDSRTTVLFYVYFPRCRLIKMMVLIWMKEMLSWFIKWHYWLANHWNAVTFSNRLEPHPSRY